MGVAIASCEIGFWLLVLAGLLARYRWRLARTSRALLAGAPVTDAVLLVVLVVHLRSGAAASALDGLAAVYLGVSVFFGRDLVAAADRRFRGARPGPSRAPWPQFGRVVAAATLSAAILLGCVAMVADPARTSALLGWLPNLGLVVLGWLVHPVWHSVRQDRKNIPAGCRNSG